MGQLCCPAVLAAQASAKRGQDAARKTLPPCASGQDRRAHDKEAAKAAAGKDQPGDKAGDKKPDTSAVKAGTNRPPTMLLKTRVRTLRKKAPIRRLRKTPLRRAAAAKAEEPRFPVPEHKTVAIGSLDPAHRLFSPGRPRSQGASVASIELNDPRYRELQEPKFRLSSSATTSICGLQGSSEIATRPKPSTKSAAQLVKEVEASRPEDPGAASAELDRVTARRCRRPPKTPPRRAQRLAGQRPPSIPMCRRSTRVLRQ